MKKILLFMFGVLLVQGCKSPEQMGQNVMTKSGEILGSYNPESNSYDYKGIPYAKSPTGDLRWRPPQPVEEWNGVLNATKFGPICMQSDPQPFMMWTQEFIAPADKIDEDCLTLNIWTKGGSIDSKRPVIVFIHGGAFTSGSGSVPIYDGQAMAAKEVVLVTINYRLGVFGFLAHPELSSESSENSSGNYGLLDQIAALEWVRDNIASFGGNPDNVTIAGQSAGAFSVNYLVASPLAKGLYHRAIAESGGALVPSNSLSSAEYNLDRLEDAGVSLGEMLNAETIEALREITADQLLVAQRQFRPVIDGYVLPKTLLEIFSEGSYNDVPVLMGWNSNEGNFWGEIESKENYRQTISERFSNHFDEFLEHFPAETDEEAAESQLDLGSLQTFGFQMWKWMKLHNETGNSDIFMYHFEKDLPFAEDQQSYGAFHTGEVPYAYQTLNKSNRPWTREDEKLSETMSSYWANFAKNGNPNGDGLTEWPAIRKEDYLTMFFGDSVRVSTIPMKERLMFLENLYTH